MNAAQFDVKDLQMAAVLHCEGMENDLVAQSLGLDDSTVVTMLETAQHAGYFRLRPELVGDHFDQETYDRANNAALMAGLSRALQDNLELSTIPVTITPSPPSMFRSFDAQASEGSQAYKCYRKAEWDSLRVASRRASQILSRSLLDGKSHTLGLNWGTAVKQTIEFVRPLPSQLGDGIIHVVSLFGDLEFYPSDLDLPSRRLGNVNCNAHVVRLAQRFGSGGVAVPLNVPGFVPAALALQEDTFQAIRSFMANHSSYRRIFERMPGPLSTEITEQTDSRERSSSALVAQMDTILTGFGSADQYSNLTSYLTCWLSCQENVMLQEFAQAGKVVGDLGGHLIPSREGAADDRVVHLLRKVNSRLMAAQPSDFVDVATRHMRTRRGGGVIGITVGARKARIIYALLCQSPCPLSKLIVDLHCALALFNLVDPSQFANFMGREGPSLAERREQWSGATKTLIPF